MAQATAHLIEVIEDLATEDLFKKACDVASGTGWYFGNRSSDEHGLPFWKMDLDGNPVFDAIWEAARSQCEAATGRKLRVIRQYGNGHTYGLGGQPHLDDNREGTYTLLFYPMLEWKPNWQGETVFHGPTGEIEVSVTPRPNRAILFDARIPHAGRAPSRNCPALRVSVAYKLEAADDDNGGHAKTGSPFKISLISQTGAQRIYQIVCETDRVSLMVENRLREMSKTLRLPGFRPGKIPHDFLISRYGAQIRDEVIGNIGTQAVEDLLKIGNFPGSLELIQGADSGDVEFRLADTHLPDLANADAGAWHFEKLVFSDSICAEAGIPDSQAAEYSRQCLHLLVCDALNNLYQFPVAESLVDRELEALLQAVGAEVDSSGLREIAERRVRLGAVVVELARRHGIGAPGGNPSLLEGRVIEWLIGRATLTDREGTLEELNEIAG